MDFQDDFNYHFCAQNAISRLECDRLDDDDDVDVNEESL